jgi:hypothetical protein
MRMKYLLPIMISSIIVMMGCAKKELYLKKQIWSDTQAIKETYYNESGKYFSIHLESAGSGSYYLAEINVKWQEGSNHECEVISITDGFKGEKLKFSGQQEFIDFMDGKGYEVYNMVNNRYGGEFTFKKK